MNYKSPMNNQNKGYGGESASQERSNLLSVNPLTKHMSTPMQMGGSKMKGSAIDDEGRTRRWPWRNESSKKSRKKLLKNYESLVQSEKLRKKMQK